jgi:16S rRNA (guanine966-N2)-methyltransferase
VRIVAGTARGRALQGPGPKMKGLRPTSDRVRESIFNILGQWMEGWSVLDLYAGTGALGLEAISRGAKTAVLVDRDPDAVKLCRANAQTLGFADHVEVLSMPVPKAVDQLGRAGRKFELIFADPPYAQEGMALTVELLGKHAVLAKEGVLVFEHDKHEKVDAAAGGLLGIADARTFGGTQVTFFRYRDPS